MLALPFLPTLHHALKEGRQLPTIFEVAQAAGVSAITASRVLNHPEQVKEQTRQRVLTAVAQLGYAPNQAARRLVSRQTGVIDVYIPEYMDIANPFVMHLIAGISDALSEQMYSFLIKRSLRKEHTCDGYIVTGLLSDEIDTFAAYARERNRPIALFGHTTAEDVDCLDVDNTAGACMATEALLSMGHRRIAYISVNQDMDFIVDRFTGYNAALQSACILPDPHLIANTINSVQGGYTACVQLLENNTSTEPFTAVFCSTDGIAIGTINALRDRGISVPGDISIIGFDGLGHHQLFEPHITTITQPIFQAGAGLAQILIDRLAGSTERVTRLLPPIFTPGNTLAPPRVITAYHEGMIA